MALFPIMNRKEKQTFIVPDMTGGVNYRDNLFLCNNNQMVDCENVWVKGGILQTRPGYTTSTTEETGSRSKLVSLNKHQVFSETSSGGKRQLYSYLHEMEADPNFVSNIEFFWASKSGFSEHVYWDWSTNKSEKITEPYYNVKVNNYFVVQKNNEIYLFTRLIKASQDVCEIFKLDLDASTPDWSSISDEDVYAPLVATNCVSKSTVPSLANILQNSTQIEGYNLISPYYRMQYSSSNPDSDGVKKFKLLQKAPVGKKVKVSLTLNGVTVDHILTVGANVYEGKSRELVSRDDNLLMVLEANKFVIYFEDHSSQALAGAIKEFDAADFVRNNMEITAPYNIQKTEYTKVFYMKISELYGGGSNGINGGTVTFLAGNSAGKYRNLVVWSAPDNPLYFGENNYYTVGNASSSVTAFAKQSDILVIFKANETYYTSFKRNESITAQSLIDQNVVDYTASSVYFPLYMINDTIGCDCPKTVELLKNRLCWTCSNGRIYTLVTNDNYNERTIYEVGQMIKPYLLKIANRESKLKASIAADWKDHYILIVGNEAFVMDYGTGGYQYPYSYHNTADANIIIPWYRWKFNESFTPEAAFSDEEKLYLLDIREESKLTRFVATIDDNLTKDGSEWIRSMVQTKMYDLIQYEKYRAFASHLKNIDSVSFMVSKQGGEPIEVEYITDYGTEQDEILPDGYEVENGSAEYMRCFTAYPCIRSVTKLGIRIKSEKAFSLQGISINYQILGGEK